MARIKEPTKAQLRAWDKWLKSRPPVVRDLAERFPPWELFRLKSSNHRVVVISYQESGTMKVAVTGQYNLVDFERAVFGITPDDLEPCELPGPDEPLGVMVPDANLDAYIDAQRVAIRPDLWTMGPDGKAVRKH